MTETIHYYLMVEHDKIICSGQLPCATPSILNVEVTEDVYNTYNADNLTYIWDGEKIVENPNYEEQAAARERQKLDALTLTPADVERALYKAKGMDFDDLKALIVQALPTVDIKGLSIEFRAKDFYRGAKANNIRLFDTVGQLLGYTPANMDYLFLNKELPE